MECGRRKNVHLDRRVGKKNRTMYLNTLKFEINLSRIEWTGVRKNPLLEKRNKGRDKLQIELRTIQLEIIVR